MHVDVRDQDMMRAVFAHGAPFTFTWRGTPKTAAIFLSELFPNRKYDISYMQNSPSECTQLVPTEESPSRQVTMLLDDTTVTVLPR